jgi:antitoxin MazE
MKAHIQKWGNSLAVRIPAHLAQSASLSKDTPIEISLVEGRIVIETVRPKYDLEELLAGITDENIHGEISTGKAVGKEVW